MLVCAPFHSISNAPVGTAYLRSFLEDRAIACPIVDLNIQARDYLLKEPGLDSDPQTRREVLDDVFSLGRRTHLGELIAWSWMHPDGLPGVLRQVRSHPSALTR